MKIFAIVVSMIMVGCSPSIVMPSLTKQAPDVLANDTDVVISSDVVGTLNKGSLVQIPEDDKVEVTLQEKVTSTVGGKEVELPKSTKVLLPPSTYLKLTESTDVRLIEGADVTLNKGTVVTISRINWYAILFYLVLIGGAFALWIYSRNKKSEPQFLNESVED